MLQFPDVLIDSSFSFTISSFSSGDTSLIKPSQLPIYLTLWSSSITMKSYNHCVIDPWRSRYLSCHSNLAPLCSNSCIVPESSVLLSCFSCSRSISPITLWNQSHRSIFCCSPGGRHDWQLSMSCFPHLCTLIALVNGVSHETSPGNIVRWWHVLVSYNNHSDISTSLRILSTLSTLYKAHLASPPYFL